MEDMHWTRYGHGRTIWVITASDSDGLTPTALHLTPVLFMSLWKHQVKTPRGTDLRGLVLGGKAVGPFQGDPEVGRPKRGSEG